MKALPYYLAVAITFFFFTGFTTSVKKYLITDYGAKGDSTTLNTIAIQNTIDKCSADGGGTVVVPKGIFASGALFLKKGVSLLVEKDAVLKGSTNQADYPQINTRWEGEERRWTSAFINAIGLQNISISGEGTIDGSGSSWPKVNRRPPGQTGLTGQPEAAQPEPAQQGPRLGRPRLICFQDCKNVSIKNLRLHNQAIWCLHVLYCEKVEVQNLNITADHTILSSDGIDVDSSTGVHITDCFIDVNDDCISIKSGKDEDGLRVNKPAKNILIEKCHFAYGHGGVAMGSETSGGITDVEVRNCTVDASNWAPIRFKTQPSRGGVVENITYRDIKLNGTRKAFEFNMAWRMVGTIKAPSNPLPVVRNIKIINVSGTASAVGDMHGLDGSPITGVSFKNCDITAETGFLLDKVINVDLSGLKIKVAKGKAVIRKD